MPEENILLISCGILKKEIRCLIKKNAWPLDDLYLDSSLHIDLGKLKKKLSALLEENKDRSIILVYGSCHPQIDEIIKPYNCLKLPVQNCVEMLLGAKTLNDELAGGAYFLLDDWMKRWTYVIANTLGDNPEVVKEIFNVDTRYFYCIETPCSTDYRKDAEKASTEMTLPLKWRNVNLDNLELLLKKAIEQKMKDL